MISKVMNFCWSGSRMTFMRYMTLYSFRKLNPNFRIILWSPSSPCRGKTWVSSEVDDDSYQGENYLPRIEDLKIERKTWSPMFEGLSHSQASDLFEWQLLSTIGGIYCDMDVLWLMPLESIRQAYWNSDVLYCLENNGQMFAIGFFGASPRCTMFQDIYHSAIRNYVPERYESAGISAAYLSTGRAHSAAATINYFKSKYPGLSISRLPDVSLYPFDCRNYPKIFTSTMDVSDRCLGLHWFGGGPVSQQWNRLLTAKNYKNYDNTFTRCCHKILDGKGDLCVV